MHNPGNLNPRLREQLHHKQAIDPSLFVEKILAGDRVYLSQAITMVESKHPNHQQKAQQILKACMPHATNAFRIGITGSPGVGKSSFIETFGKHLIEQGHRVAVLAIDPSSQFSKGSILGDKTRMGALANAEQAFIRPSPAGESLGGVARKTRETIVLCEAAGFDRILIETVGVGQSEVAVHSMTDLFLLLLLPGAGDELQGIKRGIVEMADLIAVNKADGERLPLAKRARREYQNALHLFPPKESGWQPVVALCSALEGTGMEEIEQSVRAYRDHVRDNGYLQRNRRRQARFWLHETIQQYLKSRFYGHPAVKQSLSGIEAAVAEAQITSFQGAEKLWRYFLEKDDPDDTNPPNAE